MERKKEPSAFGWLAKTNYLGSLCESSIKGIRIQMDNILVVDNKTLGFTFKKARFNGWVAGEIFVVYKALIPNARRDNFERNQSSCLLVEQLMNLVSEIAKGYQSSIVEEK